MAMHENPNRREAAIDFDLSDTSTGNPPLYIDGCAILTIDMALRGKQQGHLCLSSADPATSAGQLRIPVCVMTGDSPGPTVTLLSGIHHDEFDGPIALLNLIHSLSVQHISGRVILLPSLSPQTQNYSQPHSVASSTHVDNCFPGDPGGSDSSRIAYEVLQRFIKPADWVVDIRSGRNSIQYSDCALVRFHEDKPWQRETEQAMIAFGAPNSVRIPAFNELPSLQKTVIALRKHYVQALLGGGAGCTINSLNTARSGCRNLLRHCGCLDGEIELSSTRLLEVRHESDYVFAPAGGLLEPCAHLGREIWKGEPLARILSVENPELEPTTIDVPRDSVLLAYHRGGPVASGDLLAILADEVQR
jgi:N-alpha-acetyl-L-2,4-diaminobutyrate deacetylase